jgi:hypothetical protein
MDIKTITSCKHATRLLSEALDHPLPLSRRVLLKVHLTVCTNCLYFGRQIKILKNVVGHFAEPEDELPTAYVATLSKQAQERVKARMREDRT